MADNFVQSCFAFECSATEWSLLREAFLVSLDLCSALEPGLPSTEFMSSFPGVGDDRWAGFRDLFDNRDYPDFAADLAGGAVEQCVNWRAIISAEVSLDPMAVARLIQRCCRTTLAQNPIGFEWSISCSRQRVGEFGGGWCAVFSDRIEIESTGEALSTALSGGIL